MQPETEQPHTHTPENLQAEPVVLCDYETDIPAYNGNIIKDCDRMDSFIPEATSHSIQCGHPLMLIERNTRIWVLV